MSQDGYCKILKRKEGYGLFDNMIFQLAREYPDDVHWCYIAENPNTTLEFIKRNLDTDLETRLSMNPHINIKFIREHFEILDFYDILSEADFDFTQKETLDFLEEIRTKKFNGRKNNLTDSDFWVSLAHNKNLTFEFIKEHREQFQQTTILSNDALDFSKKEIQSFFERYFSQNKTYWENLSYNSTLTFDFVNKYADKLNWDKLIISLRFDFTKESTHEFFEKFVDKINWKRLSLNRSLTLEFIEKHLGKLDWELLSENAVLTINFIEKHLEELDWGGLVYNQSLTIDFIEKYYDELFEQHSEFWARNELNLHPVVLARNKKIYSEQLLKELIEFINNREIKANKNIFNLCVHELSMASKDFANKTLTNTKINFQKFVD